MTIDTKIGPIISRYFVQLFAGVPANVTERQRIKVSFAMYKKMETKDMKRIGLLEDVILSLAFGSPLIGFWTHQVTAPFASHGQVSTVRAKIPVLQSLRLGPIYFITHYPEYK